MGAEVVEILHEEERAGLAAQGRLVAVRWSLTSVLRVHAVVRE